MVVAYEPKSKMVHVKLLSNSKSKLEACNEIWRYQNVLWIVLQVLKTGIVSNRVWFRQLLILLTTQLCKAGYACLKHSQFSPSTSFWFWVDWDSIRNPLTWCWQPGINCWLFVDSFIKKEERHIWCSHRRGRWNADQCRWWTRSGKNLLMCHEFTFFFY